VHPGGIKTNIARASKVHPSMAELGVDDGDAAKSRFERAFRVSADEAAETILRGVQKNARRVLIGTDARMIDLLQRLLPGSYHGVLARVSRRVLTGRRPASTSRPTEAAPSAAPKPVASAQSN